MASKQEMLTLATLQYSGFGSKKNHAICETALCEIENLKNFCKKNHEKCV